MKETNDKSTKSNFKKDIKETAAVLGIVIMTLTLGYFYGILGTLLGISIGIITLLVGLIIHLGKFIPYIEHHHDCELYTVACPDECTCGLDKVLK